MHAKNSFKRHAVLVVKKVRQLSKDIGLGPRNYPAEITLNKTINMYHDILLYRDSFSEDVTVLQ